MSSRLDSKCVFREGLQIIRQKLNLRAYTSVTVFSADLARVLSSDLGVEAASTAELQLQVSGRATDLSFEQRERRKLAKRIVKAVQPALEEALRKESELSGRPFEKQIQQLDIMLDTGILSRRNSFGGSANGEGANLPDLLQPMCCNGAPPKLDGHTGEEAASHVEPNGAVPLVSKSEDASTVNAPSHPDELDGSIAQLNGELSAETETAILVDTPPASTNGVRGGIINEQVNLAEEAGASTPTLMPVPPTPPLSLEGIQQPIMISGGIPWYVEPFDPDGTTVYEERWTGPEVLREMSEELTDIDDEELQGLGSMEDEAAEQEKDVVARAVTAIPAPGHLNVKKNGKSRRRWRGFR
jgi:NuA3 HAT complex component NTO1